MVLPILMVIGGLVALYFGGDWLVNGASKLAASFGVSALVIGLTVVAFGTSAPELVVNLSAAVSGASDLAIGNVVGSNIANIMLILGAAGLIYPLAVHERLVRFELPFMFGISVLLVVLSMDGLLSRLDAGLLFSGLVVFSVAMYLFARKDRERQAELEAELGGGTGADRTGVSRLKNLGLVALGVALLLVGAQFIIEGATTIARSMGVSELVIGLTIVAFGTSLPELGASIMAALKKETDIAVGNVIGSNIFNIGMVLGATGLILPIPVDTELIRLEFPVMMAVALLLLPFAANRNLGRIEAGLFLIGYIAFIVLLFVL